MSPEGVFGVEVLRLGEVVERIGRGRQDAGRGQDVGEVERLAVLGVPRGDHVVVHGCSCRGCVRCSGSCCGAGWQPVLIRGLIGRAEFVGGLG